MSEINNPHDRLIRETFQDKAEAISFFKNTLPTGVVRLLNLDLLELSESSFVSDDLKEEQTDLLYTIPLRSGTSAQIYLLFEHKSYLDPGIYVQLLGYLSEIYRNQVRTEGKYSTVIPFVFYHGERQWTLGETLLSQFKLLEEETRVLSEFIPNFKINLFDLSGVELQERLESIALQVILGIVQRIREGEAVFVNHLPGLLTLLDEIGDESKRVAILHKLLLYIFWVKDFQPSELKEMLHRRKLERYEEVAMTTAERLIQEGIQKGRLEGKLEGKFEGKLEDARKMLAKGIDLKTVLEITELTERDLRNNSII